VWRGSEANRLRKAAQSAASRKQWRLVADSLDQLRKTRDLDDDENQLRVRAALEQQDVQGAIANLERVSETDPQAERAWMSRGLLLMELFRFREAEAMFRRCAERSPALEEARIQLVILSGMKRKPLEFERECWAYFDLCNQPIAPLRLLSRGIPFLPSRTTLDEAHDEGFLLTKALDADPEDPEIYPPLARYYLTRGEPDASFSLLEPWLEVHPDDVPCRVEWLACLLEEGRENDARPWFESIKPGFESNPRYLILRSEYLKRAARFDEAVESLRAALRLDPRNPEAHFLLTTTLQASGRLDEAEDERAWIQKSNQLLALMKHAHDSGADPEILGQAGVLCREMGRLREALAWLQLAVRAAPNNPEYQRLLDETRP
jgi:tetratricopeptide (TPR) repeat protein